MHVTETILFMLILVLISYGIHVFTKKVATPLIQVALGSIYTLLPFGAALEMDLEIFMLIFIAPILFMDGKKFRNAKLLSFQKPILFLALGLVFLNVLIMGYIIYFTMGISLPMSFALAAILSPTDAVAVRAIAGNIKLPHKVNAIVEGESMFNDASGVVAFNFALIAAITGTFNIQDAIISFIYIALGGLAVGILFAFVAGFGINKLKDFGISEPSFFALAQVLLPFLVFLSAEHFGLSGILAVVACGRTFAMLEPKLMTAKQANIRFNSEGMWGTFLFSLKGLVFVLLGMQLPIIVNDFTRDGFGLLAGLAYVILVTFTLVALRFAWMYLFISNKEPDRVKNSLIMSLSGVRGTLTLAVCLSIPFIISDGDFFQERSLILFVSSGVIILSLLIANIFLPITIGKSLEKGITKEGAEKKLFMASLASIEKAGNGQYSRTSSLLTDYFKFLLSDLSHDGKKRAKIDIKNYGDGLREALEIGLDSNNPTGIKRLLATDILDTYELEFAALQIQKSQIKALLEKGEIDSITAYHLRRDISLEEAALFEDDIESLD